MSSDPILSNCSSEKDPGETSDAVASAEYGASVSKPGASVSLSHGGDSGSPGLGGPLRLPPWLRVRLPRGPVYAGTMNLLKELRLNTVCQGARCPNQFECFARGTATFMILGANCTRNCAFCNIGLGEAEAVDPGEPGRLAEAAARMGLGHVVVTSVTRDDLPDGGAGHFAAVTRAIRAACPRARIELLIPDFRGDETALRLVLSERPDIINHNVETPPAHYPRIRPQADYRQSLTLLKRVKKAGLTGKSGFMVGLGETDEEVRGVLSDLAAVDCDIVTIGQYLAPSRRHTPAQRYVHPDMFAEYAAWGRELGIKEVFSSPLARSSYHAGEVSEALHSSVGGKL